MQTRLLWLQPVYCRYMWPSKAMLYTGCTAGCFNTKTHKCPARLTETAETAGVCVRCSGVVNHKPRATNRKHNGILFIFTLHFSPKAGPIWSTPEQNFNILVWARSHPLGTSWYCWALFEHPSSKSQLNLLIVIVALFLTWLLTSTQPSHPGQKNTLYFLIAL